MSLVIRRLYAGESLPDAIDAIDVLIVMGGPQNCGHDHRGMLTSSTPTPTGRLVAAYVEVERAVVGVCWLLHDPCGLIPPHGTSRRGNEGSHARRTGAGRRAHEDRYHSLAAREKKGP